MRNHLSGKLDRAVLASKAAGCDESIQGNGRFLRAFHLPIICSLTLGFLALVGGFCIFSASLEQTEILPGHAEGVVALTGGAERISDAVDLVAKGHADRLLITGVNQATSSKEIARLTPNFRALLGCCIDLGYDAQNTIGNAAETRRWVRDHNIRSLIVVTSAYHMPRALAEIGSALPNVRLQAYPVFNDRIRGKQWWKDGGIARLLVWEYLKYLAALVRINFTSVGDADEPIIAEVHLPDSGP